MNSFFRIPLFFALFVLLGLSFGFITFKILSFSRTVEVPSLKNLTLLQANESVSRKGLYLKIEGEDFDPVIQAGRIMRQDIPSGKNVKEKRSIKVVVSKGPRISSIPLLVQKSFSEAESMLMEKGLSIAKVISVHSDEVGKGKVIAQKPEPHEKLSGGITVLVSLGPHELIYLCPDFLDKSVDYAMEIAQKLGIVLETKGTGRLVAAQKPGAGTLIKNTDVVHLELKEGIIYD